MTKSILILFLTVLSISSCDNVKSQTKPKSIQKNEVKSARAEKASFVHTVFFWMKEDLSEKEAKFFESEMEKLGSTPSILTYKWGKPAGTPRDLVDNSYTYAWIVDFASSENQDAYQVDPIHLAFIESCKDLWTKVQVYDTLIE